MRAQVNRACKSRGEQCPERPHETHRDDSTAGEDRLLVAEPTKLLTTVSALGPNCPALLKMAYSAIGAIRLRRYA